MIRNIISNLKKQNVKLLNKIEIKSVDLKKKQVIYKQKFKLKKINYDIIVNTIPCPIFLKITTGLPKKYKHNLLKLRYCPAVCITFGTTKFLDKKNYWINLFNEQPHIIMQHSILNDVYPWKVSWILRYGGSEEDLNKSDSQIKQEYFKSLKKYFPNIKILWSKVSREYYAEPVYDKDYIQYAPKLKTPVKNLYMTGIQTTYPKIRNMNVALESGESVARVILKDLSKKNEKRSN